MIKKIFFFILTPAKRVKYLSMHGWLSYRSLARIQTSFSPFQATYVHTF
jgi:hypothetical protein